jgi:hypothetical protein
MKRFVYWYGSEKNVFSFVKSSDIISYEEGCRKGYNNLSKRSDANSLTRRERKLLNGLRAIKKESKLDPKDRSFTNFEYENISGVQPQKRHKGRNCDLNKIRKTKHKMESTRDEQTSAADDSTSSLSARQAISFTTTTSELHDSRIIMQTRNSNNSRPSDILKLIPHDVQQDFLSLGFCKWKKDGFLPILQLGPFHVEAGDARDSWMDMFQKVSFIGRNESNPFHYAFFSDRKLSEKKISYLLGIIYLCILWKRVSPLCIDDL